MTLPACQQRILDGMAGTLRAGDPRLASIFSIFTRLNRQEPMPLAEELPADRLRALRGLPGLRGLSRAGRSVARLRAAVIVPVALAAIAGLLFLTSTAGSPRACGPVRGTRVSARTLGRASMCASGPAARTVQHSRH